MRLILIRCVQLLLVVQLSLSMWKMVGPWAALSIGIGFLLLVGVWFALVRRHFNATQNLGIWLILLASTAVVCAGSALWSNLGALKAFGLMVTVALGITAFWANFMRGHLSCETTRKLAAHAFEAGDWTKAEELFLSVREQAGKLRSRKMGPQTSALLDLAKFHGETNRLQLAEEYARGAVILLEEPGNPLSRNHLLPALFDLLQYLEADSKFAKADEVIDRILELTRKETGARSRRMADQFHEFGLRMAHQHRFAKAVLLFQSSLSILNEIDGVDKADVANCLMNLGNAQKGTHMYEDAIRSLGQALEMIQKEVGTDDVRLVPMLNNLGAAYKQNGHAELAVAVYRRAIFIREQVLGKGHPKVASVLNNLAGALCELRRFEEAEAAADKARHILSRAGESMHYVLDTLAQIKTACGRHYEADKLFHTAVHLLQQKEGPKHLELANYLERHAVVLHTLGRDEEAEEAMMRVDEIRSMAVDYV